MDATCCLSEGTEPDKRTTNIVTNYLWYVVRVTNNHYETSRRNRVPLMNGNAHSNRSNKETNHNNNKNNNGDHKKKTTKTLP